MLSVKVLMPAFKVLRSNTLVLDGNKKGRILLEWTPRTADGTYLHSLPSTLCSKRVCHVHV
jgi:hypothetical protein